MTRHPEQGQGHQQDHQPDLGAGQSGVRRSVVRYTLQNATLDYVGDILLETHCSVNSL